MLDRLLTAKKQTRPNTPLDLLLRPKEGESQFDRLLHHYLVACKVEGKSPKTVDIYSSVIGYFAQFAQANNMPQDAASISATDIRFYLLSLKERGLGSASVNAYYRALNTFFNWLEAEGFLTRSPMFNIKPPKLDKKVIRPFSRQDIENLLILCSGTNFLDLRNRAIILLFLDTGLRLKELASIQLHDITFDQETVRVMGKGAKERVVRMGKTTQKALLKYLLSRNDDHPCLWVTEERRVMAPSAIQTTIKRFCRRAGISEVKPGPHTFRHTFAITFLRNGGDIFSLQIILGHSSLDMTRRYLSSLGVDDAFAAHQKASPVDRMFGK